jgi:F-type H+-transporting ATPase subunit delta
VAIKKSEIELLSNRYAKAIFGAAKSANKLDVVSKDLAKVSETIDSNEEFAKTLASGAIVKDKMKGIFSDISKKLAVDEITKSFLLVIAENKRGSIIPQITAKLEGLILADSNTIKATVFSAKALNDNEIEGVKKSLEKSTGKKVITENKIQKEIIGGLKVKMGSTLFDDSVSTKLDRLKQSLNN